MLKPTVNSKSGRVITILALSTLAILYFIINSVGGNAYNFIPLAKEAELESGSSTDCTRSFNGIVPVNQYVVMIDAGSSGSRVHVYHFNNCKAAPRLVSEEFKMLEPGLSSYKADPEEAAKSLDPLLKLALDTVPEESRKCTPVAVKATAGLRLIGEEKAQAILEAVRQRLQNDYPFKVDEGAVSMLSGSDEGAYAWITINYLLGNIAPGAKSNQRKETAAVFDLGGGSTQIVFEPEDRVLVPDQEYKTRFGELNYELYQHSHLGYGLNVARETIQKAIVENYLKAGTDVVASPLINPCLPPGGKLKDVKIEVNEKEYVVNFIGPKEGSLMQCQKLAEDHLHKDASCSSIPCSFNGIHQPILPVTTELYVISYFYDRTHPLGMPSSFTIADLYDLGHKVCSASNESFKAIDGAVSELKENPQWCGDLGYMLALLDMGYGIDRKNVVRIAKKISGFELGWCLGASLEILEASATCKI